MIGKTDRSDPEVSPNSLARYLWDVAIIGAGPAGATAAINLSKNGHRVLLIDKESFPRDKICGDGLIADAIGSLRRSGLYEEVFSNSYFVRSSTIYSPSRIQFSLPGEFLTIKRFTLDNLIVRKAVLSGTTFLRGKITDIEPQGNDEIYLSVYGIEKRLRARIALLATGANVELGAKLGLITKQRPGAVALRCYVRSPVLLDHLVISYDRSITPGYAWIFPLGNNEFNIGCGIFYRRSGRCSLNLRDTYQRFITHFPLAAEILQKSTGVSPLRGAMLRCGLQEAGSICRGNILAIGETIGATFPFTGEGIGKAMETAEIAAEVSHKALTRGNTECMKEYRPRIETELRPKFLGYHIAQSWLSKPRLNDFVARRITKSAFLKNMVTGILNETVDPREVFSLRSMILSFLR